MRDVYIAGIGSTTFGKHADTTIENLAVGAVVDALLDSSVDRAEVGALYLGNFISGPLNGKEVLAGIVADRIGLGSIPCTKVEGACASGGLPLGTHVWLLLVAKPMLQLQLGLRP